MRFTGVLLNEMGNGLPEGYQGAGGGQVKTAFAIGPLSDGLAANYLVDDERWQFNGRSCSLSRARKLNDG